MPPGDTKTIKTICVDLDGVLAEYDGWKGINHIGKPIPGAKEFLQSLCAIPAKVCIWTTRTNPAVNYHDVRSLRLNIEDWLVEHDMPFDSIACGEGKPLASAYVDDRAVVCRPQKDPAYYDDALGKCVALIGVKAE